MLFIWKILKGSSEKLDIIQAERDIVQRSITILPEKKKKDSKSISYEREESLEIAKRIINLNEDLKSVSDVISNTLKEIDRIKVWGDFNPMDIDLLRRSGIDFKLYELKISDYKELSDDIMEHIAELLPPEYRGYYTTRQRG